MPTQYRSFFAANNMIVRYRYRKDGVYEARFHRKGIDVEVSSKDLNTLKDKFIEKLNNKGKANVKYIIIGTICILLAIAVVVVAYILIQKKTTGV